jgi:hypothetical protein
MDIAHPVHQEAAVGTGPARERKPTAWLCLVTLPASLFLWAVGVSEVNIAKLDTYGLPAILPLVFYAGVLLLIVSAGLELSRSQLSDFKLGLHAVVLAVMLYGTAPLVYKEGRYSWLYKTVGVIQYVGSQGKLNRSIDVYQSWPGFFALAAWFDKVAGVDTPLDYAKWAQLVFELAAIPLLYSIYRSIELPVWHRWLAIMLYLGANWIGQDYLSPQGISTVLSLGIMAIVSRWLFSIAPQRSSRYERSEEYGRLPRAEPTTGAQQNPQIGPFVSAFLILFFVLTFTHELSPYIIVIQLVALSVFGLIRPRWVAAAAAIIALAYLLPNFSYVNSHFGVVGSIGHFISNIEPPSATASGKLPPSHDFISACSALLCIVIWLLALAGAWLRRKSRSIVLALLLLTFSTILVLALGGYGNEGILRIYLFSLPWAVALAACALASPRSTGGAASSSAMRNGHSVLRAVPPLIIVAGLFFPAFFGDDLSNEMPADQVNAILAFQNGAQPGPILVPFANLPVSDTAKYNLFPIGAIFGQGGALGSNPVTSDTPTFLARTMEKYTDGQGPAYLIITPSMAAYDTANGGTKASNFGLLSATLEKSSYWTIIMDQDGITVYELTPAALSIKNGPYAKTLVIGVP